jgi:tetratricopeptide (TPR) repeat protein
MSNATMDYYSQLTEDVANLGDRNTAEARQALYDRERELIAARLGGASAPLELSVINLEKAAFDEACLKVEANYSVAGANSKPGTESSAAIGNLGRDLLVHLFGEDGFTSLRAGNWRFISVIAPVFGFFADVCTVFAHAAPALLLVFAVVGVLLTLPILFRTKYCRHCAVPSVFAFIMVFAFGFVAVTQKVFAAEGEGVAAKYIPGIREVQTTLAEILGLQKSTLTVVKQVQSDTTDIKSGVNAVRAQNDAILQAINRQSGVPIDALRAILREMGDLADAVDAGEIVKSLTAKAGEFKELTERLNRLSSDDPDVARLRQEAAEALKSGHFAEADARLAAAEARDLAGIENLQALAKQKRLSAANSRAERAAAAMLRVNPDAYQEAVVHYGEAARIAASADAKIARNYAYKQGATMMALGNEFGRNAALLDAIEHFRAMLTTTDQTADAHDWARAQVNLGLALWKLGEREAGTAKLEAAVVAYREALKEYTQARVPLAWAATQNDLGLALWRLGEREAGTAKFEEAVTAYREALKERTQERVPLDWAMTQNNLGIALGKLGEREADTAKLEEAVTAYREALKERTQARAPLGWAQTQNNLGNALKRLGEREAGTAKLEEAVTAYREALKERTQARVPLDWAQTQNNLGTALGSLGEREAGTTKFEEAVTAYREALKEYTQERVPLNWAQTQNNLGNALERLGEQETGTTKFEEAVTAYREALKEYTQERVPLDWAMTQNNLGIALRALGEREADTAKLEEAVVAYREALKERTQARVPLDWAQTQNNLGTALWRLGKREAGTAKLEEAVAAYREALKERTQARVPRDWAATQNNLTQCLALLDQRRNK